MNSKIENFTRIKFYNHNNHKKGSRQINARSPIANNLYFTWMIVASEFFIVGIVSPTRPPI